MLQKIPVRTTALSLAAVLLFSSTVLASTGTISGSSAWEPSIDTIVLSVNGSGPPTAESIALKDRIVFSENYERTHGTNFKVHLNKEILDRVSAQGYLFCAVPQVEGVYYDHRGTHKKGLKGYLSMRLDPVRRSDLALGASGKATLSMRLEENQGRRFNEFQEIILKISPGDVHPCFQRIITLTGNMAGDPMEMRGELDGKSYSLKLLPGMRDGLTQDSQLCAKEGDVVFLADGQSIRMGGVDFMLMIPSENSETTATQLDLVLPIPDAASINSVFGSSARYDFTLAKMEDTFPCSLQRREALLSGQAPANLLVNSRLFHAGIESVIKKEESLPINPVLNMAPQYNIGPPPAQEAAAADPEGKAALSPADEKMENSVTGEAGVDSESRGTSSCRLAKGTDQIHFFGVYQTLLIGCLGWAFIRRIAQRRNCP